MNIATLLKKLIEKKYYNDRTIIENKLNVFYAMSKITDEEYSNLVLKVEEVYAVEETTAEVQATENVENVENSVESEAE